MSEDEQGAGSGGRGKVTLSGGAIAAIVGAAVIVIFMLQNTTSVSVTLLVWDFTWPLWLLVLFSAIAGALVQMGAGALRRRRSRRTETGD